MFLGYDRHSLIFIEGGKGEGEEGKKGRRREKGKEGGSNKGRKKGKPCKGQHLAKGRFMKGQPDKPHSGFSCCHIPDPRGSELLPAQGPCFTPCAGCPVHHLHPLSPALLQPMLQPPGCQRYEPTIPRLRCLHLILPWACCPFLSWTPKEMCFDFHMCKQHKCEGGGISWGNLTINRQELVDKCSFFPALGQLILVG